MHQRLLLLAKITSGHPTSLPSSTSAQWTISTSKQAQRPLRKVSFALSSPGRPPTPTTVPPPALSHALQKSLPSTLPTSQILIPNASLTPASRTEHPQLSRHFRRPARLLPRRVHPHTRAQEVLWRSATTVTSTLHQATTKKSASQWESPQTM